MSTSEMYTADTRLDINCERHARNDLELKLDDRSDFQDRIIVAVKKNETTGAKQIARVKVIINTEHVNARPLAAAVADERDRSYSTSIFMPMLKLMTKPNEESNSETEPQPTSPSLSRTSSTSLSSIASIFVETNIYQIADKIDHQMHQSMLRSASLFNRFLDSSFGKEANGAAAPTEPYTLSRATTKQNGLSALCDTADANKKPHDKSGLDCQGKKVRFDNCFFFISICCTCISAR